MANESGPIRLLSLVRSGTNSATPHSWERLNHSMQAALRLAIGSGMLFRSGDFRRIYSEFRGHMWFSREDAYGLAVFVGNGSAVAAFEADLERTAFIADGVRPGSRASSEFLHSSTKL